VAGGDICRAWRLDRPNERPIFVKHLPDAPPGFFEAESKGLALLAEPRALLIPEVLAHSDEPAAGFLALEWIESGPPGPDTDDVLGRGLAQLHLSGLDGFGGDGRPAYLGPVPLDSSPAATWSELLAERRLRPLVRRGVERRRLPSAIARRVERVADRVASLAGPPEPPARIHGDLWSGNVLIGSTGEPWLIDPSAHGGHRETDLAMMRLFGGFGDRCFAAYEEVAPLADGWQERVPLHQLVPLLVHVILFGAAYEPSLDRALTALGG
jgi:fructosamine-3-kinase